MKLKQIIGSLTGNQSALFIMAQLFEHPLDFYQHFSNYYKLIKAFFRIIITIIYNMNPFFYQNYLYRQPNPFNWFQGPPYQPNDFYRFYCSTSHPVPPLHSTNMQPLKRDYHTKPQIIKVEESENDVQDDLNLPNEEKTKKNSKKKEKNNTETKQTNTVEKVKNKSEIKVKYFDPSKAPTITTDQYNLIVNQQRENSYVQKIQQISETSLNQLNFPQNDSFPFIVFKHRRIKKKYRVYLKQEDMRQFQAKQNFDSSLSDDACLSSQSKDEIQQQIQNSKVIKLIQQDNNQKIDAYLIENKISPAKNNKRLLRKQRK